MASGLLKVETVVKLAEACLGWPYVFGAAGELCTPATRKKYYNNYATRDPDEAAQNIVRFITGAVMTVLIECVVGIVALIRHTFKE